MSRPSECHPNLPHYCKGKCRNCYERFLRARNPQFAERQRENARQWSDRNRGRKRHANNQYRPMARMKKLARQYGVLADGIYCAICQCPRDGISLSIDHDHETGLARGFLCRQCNIALGHFKDSIDLLERAIAYLKAPPLQQGDQHEAA